MNFLLATVLSTHILLQGASHRSLPEASGILDRYVQVTHGADLSKPFAFSTVDFSVSDNAGKTYYATVYRARSGGLRTVVDDDDNPREWGAADGLVWSFSKASGAHLLTGKAAIRVLAETHGFSAGSLAAFATGWGGGFQSDDWHDAFSSVTTVAETTINNARCYEVLLKRKDGSTLHRWYEVKSGLLAREITSEFDEKSNEETYQTDVAEYATSLGFTYPSLLHISLGSRSFTVKINSVSRGYTTSSSAFEIPRDVARTIAQAKTPAGLPNAVDLIEHFAEVTRGGQALDSIRSEVMKANLSMEDANLEIPMVFYVRGPDNYFSLDIPTMGKFEYGSNRDVAWERSVVLGPKLLPRSQFRGFLGPDAGEILTWTNEGLAAQTVRKEETNGLSCYVVEMGTKDEGSATELYFDAKTGYLLRMYAPAQAGRAAEQVTLGDYRKEDGFTLAHHIESTLAGKAVRIAITEVHFNASIPDALFNIPEDVAALLQQQQQEQAHRCNPDLSRPTLRRRPDH